MMQTTGERINARVFPLGIDFLRPFLEPVIEFVSAPESADFILAMNNTTPGYSRALSDARRYGKPLAWWTIEDPNSFETFLPQAVEATHIFTTDEACIPRYVQRLGHHRVFPLPLACSPAHHRPLPLREDATDFVISANWYTNEARFWGVQTVVEPIREAGYSLALFCYRTFMWRAPYDAFWRGETSYLDVASQYTHGRVVLGLNNQHSGLDGRAYTTMTSMRTFEALACGKSFLAASSDAYERLGLVKGVHMMWTDSPKQTLEWAQRLLLPEGEVMATEGRAFVLAHHTYRHRLEQIAEHVLA